MNYIITSCVRGLKKKEDEENRRRRRRKQIQKIEIDFLEKLNSQHK